MARITIILDDVHAPEGRSAFQLSSPFVFADSGVRDDVVSALALVLDDITLPNPLSDMAGADVAELSLFFIEDDESVTPATMSEARVLLGLAIGTNVQAWSAMLDTVAGKSFSGTGNIALVGSPTFTGTPAAPTAGNGTNTTQIATTQFVTTAVANAVANLVASAPGALDTLDELAAALGDDASFAATTATALGNRLRFDAAQSLSGGQQAQALANLGVVNADADGSTLGLAAFTAADFNAASGVISIDYTNGQAASGSTKGFLTSADWTTFNGKQSALGFTAENVANKSTDVVADGASDTKYPSVKAVKDYVDANAGGGSSGYTGEVRFGFFTSGTVPAGWLLLTGQTIGDASSGADFADADAEDLFVHLWTVCDNANAAVSGGRGASAAADWAAHKTLAMPNPSGRVPVAQDSGTFGALGNDEIGAETHALSTGELAAHTHTGGAHTHGGVPDGEVTPDADGGGNTVNVLQLSSGGTTGSGGEVETSSAGSGTAHNNIQPSIVLAAIIKL